MGSYNYLGFGECEGPCTESARNAIDSFGISSCSSRLETGECLFSVLGSNDNTKT